MRTICPEPDGAEQVLVSEGGRLKSSTAHQVFIEENGQCPWCGAVDSMTPAEMLDGLGSAFTVIGLIYVDVEDES